MAEQETHKHETHAHSSTVAKADTLSPTTLIVFVVALLIVAVAAYMLGLHNGAKAQSNSTASASVLNSNYNNPTTVIPQPSNSTPVKVNVSASSYFILPSEASSLIGPGSYSAYIATTPAQVALMLEGLLPSAQAFNVSSAYLISYNTSSKLTFGGVQELVVKSPEASAVYQYGLETLGTNYFNQTALSANKNLSSATVELNQSVPGLTYSLSIISSNVPSSNETSQGVLLIGHTANATVFVQTGTLNNSATLNSTEIVALVASHLK